VIMHALTAWFIRNPVAANLIMAFILIWGVMSLWGIRIEGFPRIPPDTISISVVYPGATAQQVDESVTGRIQDAVTGLQGVRRITSYSMEGYGVVELQALGGYSLNRLIEDTRTRVDGISDLPARTERPQIVRDEFNFPAMIVQIYGDTDQETLQRLGRRLKEDLLAQPEITQVQSWGERRIDLVITPDIARLESLGMTLGELAARVQTESVLYRAGELQLSGRRLELRADERLHASEALRDMVVLTNASNGLVRLGDIAEIERSFEDDDFEVMFQGQPTLGFSVLIGQADNIMDVRTAVDRVMADTSASFPDTVHVEVWADQSTYISERLSLLRDNAIQGLLIVLVLLSIFLSPSLAFWVALGIPISIAGAISLMRWQGFDYSLNDITTFGMIIALGILVDDAIVVGESVYEERSKDPNRIRATERGVKKVATATIFGVATTIAAFSPMLMIQNPLGKVLAGFAAVVIFALIFSLFESKFILPAHLAETRIGGTAQHLPGRLWARLQAWVNSPLERFRDQLYVPILKHALTYRYGVVMGFAALAVLVIGLMANGTIRTTFFPEIPGSYATVIVNMDRSASYDLTLSNARQIENAYATVNAEFAQRPDVDGAPAQKLMVAVLGPQQIEIYAEMKPEAERDVETLAFLNAWREATGALEGSDDVQFTASEDVGGGFAIELTSRNETALEDGIRRITASLNQIEGLSNVRDDLSSSRPQLRLRLTAEGRLLGLTSADLAQMVGDQYGGYEAERFLREGEETRITLRRSDDNRGSIADLESARLRLPSGDWVALTAIAEIESGFAPNDIRRRNLRRSAMVYAKVDKSLTSAPRVYAALSEELDALREDWPELRIAGEGELEEENRMQRGLLKAFGISMILIYVLLAIPLKSYWKPVVIMSVIPFGIVGAAFGHMILGLPLSLLSFFGLLALSGIVVNDSLVLLTRYNDLRAEGLDTQSALVEAGRSRLRAILLTTITTVAGLTPLMMETSEQAQYLIPAAVSLAAGEIFATAITLVLVPCVTAIGVDVLGERISSEEDEMDTEAHPTLPPESAL